jgi:hypothetical protein
VILDIAQDKIMTTAELHFVKVRKNGLTTLIFELPPGKRIQDFDLRKIGSKILQRAQYGHEELAIVICAGTNLMPGATLEPWSPTNPPPTVAAKLQERLAAPPAAKPALSAHVPSVA